MTLQPCPFCAHSAEAFSLHKDGYGLARFYVRCSNDACPVEPHTRGQATPADAAKRWNTRELAAMEKRIVTASLQPG